ncbi:MAG: hypothetical protein M3387_08860, partial [Actinomycetota bacterium]|nr:hypothetical protein [Actinomycetota bacterium]
AASSRSTGWWRTPLMTGAGRCGPAGTVKDPPVDIWIDADGLVPRQETVINFAREAEPPAELSSAEPLRAGAVPDIVVRSRTRPATGGQAERRSGWDGVGWRDARRAEELSR